MQNKINGARLSFCDLFMTIEETAGYKKAIITLDAYQKDLKEMEEQLKQLLT
ncbi:hypothetical protein LWM68_40825 [Niabella sp. W65]|nr:hypothetical protein [Niabella sp. W65]MCH7368517.1 hypothetical protein [Niabella sp. W65]ULT44106.1 hypothetical protein KRR40_12520 [Niabella sp. I65]